MVAAVVLASAKSTSGRGCGRFGGIVWCGVERGGGRVWVDSVVEAEGRGGRETCTAGVGRHGTRVAGRH